MNLNLGYITCPALRQQHFDDYFEKHIDLIYFCSTIFNVGDNIF